MRCIIFNNEEIIKDDLGVAKELFSYARLVLQSGTVVSVRSTGLDIILMPIDTIAGKLVLGLLKDEPLFEAMRYYVDHLLLNAKRWPTVVEKLAKYLDPWQGKRYVGLLSSAEIEKRFLAREKLASIALRIVNVGEYDLYVFSTELLSPIISSKLCVSSFCDDPKEAIRQALIVEKYVRGQGVFFYEKLHEYDLLVQVDPSDVRIVRYRLLSSSLEDFAKKMNSTVKEAFQLQCELEEKYLLSFNVGMECCLYARGLTTKDPGGHQT